MERVAAGGGEIGRTKPGGIRTAVVRAISVLACLTLSGCLGLEAYYAAADAPDYIKAGKADIRLTTTRALGGPLSPIVRNIAVPRGKLASARGLEQYLLRTLRPLDVVIVRSRPALTRAAFPTHFTHVAIWLGKEGELKRAGVTRLAAARLHLEDFGEGKTLLESANDDVHLSEIFEVMNTSEIAIVRLAWAKGDQRRRYSHMFEYLGQPFDYNFDLKDERRLTCIEVMAKVFPEVKLPVRYTTGRYTYIPDDLARMSTRPGNGVSFVAYITPDGKGGFDVHDGATMLESLSMPSVRNGPS